ncbi:EcsC family protein [Staphylococcus simulans]|uniref:EcsC family protein n=1 Tax=Staphylococcus simulans TaxID=1286 RepID=UPI00399C2E23
MEELNQGKMEKLLDWSYDKALNGVPGTPSAIEIAENYLRKYPNSEVAINKMIKMQAGKTATSGFLTGFGGLITLPVSIPANIASVVYVQMRMIAIIAHIRGYDLKDDEVQTMVYMCLTGQSIADVAKNVGISFAKKAGTAQIRKIPGTVLTKINQKVGFRLITKFGEKGVVNLGKMVPALGGAIGATFDFTSTKAIAKVAKSTFEPVSDNSERNRIIIN